MHVVESTVDSDVRNAYQARCGAATFSSTCSLVTFTTVIVKYDLNYKHNLLSLCGESPCLSLHKSHEHRCISKQFCKEQTSTFPHR